MLILHKLLVAYRYTGYNPTMIRSFEDNETERIFQRRLSTHFPTNIQNVTYRKLAMLHSARRLNDLRSTPGNQLEKLKGDRNGQYSIRINDRWCICFEWLDGDAYLVEIVDYHS
jgi:proteic killer suppression protein